MARYDADKHHRRSIRLRGWGYTQGGAYFVTICTHQGECLFDDPTLRDIAEQTWQELPNRFASITLDEFVFMPNHVHFIVWLNPRGDDGAGVGAQFNCAPTGRPADEPTPIGNRFKVDKQRPTLGQIVRTFKALVTRRIHQVQPEISFAWQRNYYERVIRNERELHAIRQYIRDNPAHWAEDAENPARGR